MEAEEEGELPAMRILMGFGRRYGSVGSADLKVAEQQGVQWTQTRRVAGLSELMQRRCYRGSGGNSEIKKGVAMVAEPSKADAGRDGEGRRKGSGLERVPTRNALSMKEQGGVGL